MAMTNEASELHLKAADDHEAAATYHRKAADSHDKNKLKDAKGSAKAAMDCCTTAQAKTASACACTAK
jgi:hypothetical protein